MPVLVIEWIQEWGYRRNESRKSRTKQQKTFLIILWKNCLKHF